MHAYLDLPLYQVQEWLIIRFVRVICGVYDQHLSIPGINQYTDPMVPTRIKFVMHVCLGNNFVN
jgi:hypothetical protein